MTVTKDGKDYTVVIYKNTWALIRREGPVTIRYSVEKALCSDLESLQAYVLASDLF